MPQAVYTVAKDVVDRVAEKLHRDSFLANRKVTMKRIGKPLTHTISFKGPTGTYKLRATADREVKWDAEVVWPCFPGDENLPVSATHYLAALANHLALAETFKRRTVRGFVGS